METQTFYVDDLAIGHSATMTRTVQVEDVKSFAELSGDFNPIHLDEEFAATTRFGRCIAHGMLSANYISTVIGTQLPGSGTIYMSQSIHFKAPVYLDDEVNTTVEVIALDTERSHATLFCVCKVGDTVVIEGEAMVLVPRRR
jgi:3-hydroxybutyryl-CoA dehydratase